MRVGSVWFALLVRAGPVCALLLCALLAGCGLSVQSADLFQLTRSGQGQRLTILVNDSGTIRCNGGGKKLLADPQLLTARDLAADLNDDAKSGLRLPSAGRVFTYTIKLQNGTLSFGDTAAARHPELARAELFAAQAADGSCR